MRSTIQMRWRVLSEGLPGPFWALVAGVFVTRAGNFVAPLLFVYLTQLRQMSLSAAGFISAISGAGSLVGSLSGGALADRLGRRVTMLGALLSGAAWMLLLGAASAPWQLASSAFFVGASADAFRPAAQAVVADLVAPSHRLKAFAIQYWAVNLGFAFAAVVGGLMATRSFAALFIGDAATTLALAAILWRWVPETRPAHLAAQPSTVSLLTPFLDRRFAPFLGLNFIVVAVFLQHLTGLPTAMRERGFSTQAFGAVVASNGVWIVLLQPLLTPRLQHLSRPTLLAVAAALTGLGVASTGVATSVLQFYASVAIWTLGEILFAPVNASVVADLSPADGRGRYQGAFTLTWALGAMVSPAIGPAVMERWGMGPYWIACGALGLATAAAHLIVTPRCLSAPVVASPDEGPC